MATAEEEIGRTVRVALESWDRTVRLCVLLMVSALAGAAFLAIRWLPLITW